MLLNDAYRKIDGELKFIIYKVHPTLNIKIQMMGYEWKLVVQAFDWCKNVVTHILIKHTANDFCDVRYVKEAAHLGMCSGKGSMSVDKWNKLQAQHRMMWFTPECVVSTAVINDVSLSNCCKGTTCN